MKKCRSNVVSLLAALSVLLLIAACNVVDPFGNAGITESKETSPPNKGGDQGEDNDDQGEDGKGQTTTCRIAYNVSDVIYRRGPGLNDLYDSYRFPHHSGGSGEFYWEYYDYFVIKSVREKDELIARWKTAFEERGHGWTWSTEPTSSWLKTLEQYDGNYFKNNNLVLILKTEPSGSNVLEVASVTVKNNALNIVIDRDGGGITDDMGYWHILIPVQKCFFNGAQVNVEVVNKFDVPPQCDYDISSAIHIRAQGMSFNFLEEPYWGRYPYFVMKSGSEKNELLSAWKAKLGENYRGSWVGYGDFFDTLLGDYNDAFFVNNNLVMILSVESSGGYKNEVASLAVQNNELDVVINRWGGGSNCGMTADIGYWYILVPVKKCFFNGNVVNVERVDLVFPQCR